MSDYSTVEEWITTFMDSGTAQDVSMINETHGVVTG